MVTYSVVALAEAGFNFLSCLKYRGYVWNFYFSLFGGLEYLNNVRADFA
jgi:hypothetical protein